MTALSHDLAEEFPGKADLIRRVAGESAHFANLLEKNHHLWKEIQQIQKDIRPAEDAALEALEKQRLSVLDEIAAMLAKAEQG
ncbi:MAG: hypothetical protein KGS44_06075 [Alphaproteobacteria bacterium]|nr:hypothetical protein [Alphaproteobacteria bacterium]